MAFGRCQNNVFECPTSLLDKAHPGLEVLSRNFMDSLCCLCCPGNLFSLWNFSLRSKMVLFFNSKLYRLIAVYKIFIRLLEKMQKTNYDAAVLQF